MHTQFVRLERISTLFSSLASPFVQLNTFIARFMQLASDRSTVAQESLKNMTSVSQSNCELWEMV